ncbi:hypothetical protein ACFE04_026198 [Oxalis oulophora]
MATAEINFSHYQWPDIRPFSSFIYSCMANETRAFAPFFFVSLWRQNCGMRVESLVEYRRLIKELIVAFRQEILLFLWEELGSVRIIKYIPPYNIRYYQFFRMSIWSRELELVSQCAKYVLGSKKLGLGLCCELLMVRADLHTDDQTWSSGPQKRSTNIQEKKKLEKGLLDHIWFWYTADMCIHLYSMGNQISPKPVNASFKRSDGVIYNTVGTSEVVNYGIP